MKLSCTRENLHQGLSIVSRVSTKNVNLPILNNVLLKADGGGLKLISTNLEIAISCSIRAKVEQQGEYTVPSKLFFDYVNLLPNEKVDLDLLDSTLSISCSSAKTKINGITATEFPLIPPVTGGVNYSVSSLEFQKALSQVLFAASTNESRPELSGIFMNFRLDGSNTLVLAATDSYRLSEVEMSVHGDDAQMQVIVPQRTLSELGRILSVFKDDVDAAPSVNIALTDNQIVFTYGSVELTSRTIEGQYPDYKQIIPSETKNKVIIDKNEFVQAIKTVSLFSKIGLYDIALDILPNEKKIRLAASDKTRGENSILLDADITGPENKVVLNYKYLIDGVNASHSPRTVFKMIDGGNPCVIAPEDMPGEKFQYIIMPIRQ
ncbi:DNA polymerase III subunit beta [Patescibacteria group bacterium]|nr:DNA polymerase III subunit beta [Patescibacteria group bacterium]